MTTNTTTKKHQPITPRKQPLRRCVGCGQMEDKRSLTRINKSKEGVINIDPTNKQHGRAAYLCLDHACLQKAKKTKGIERSFKCAISAEIYDELAKQLEVVL